MNILVEIPARGGSKGVPRKALRRLGEIPLIAYTVRDALNIPGVTKVFVSTDDPEIRAVSIEYGAEVPFLRPAELAQDDSRLEDVRVHDLKWYEENEGFTPDIEIIMSPTHPFRRPNLIGDALQGGLRDSSVFNIGSLSPAHANLGNYWRVSGGKVVPFPMPSDPLDADCELYQSAFSFNIVFNYRRDVLHRRRPVILNEIESIDIDVPSDLEIARLVIEEGLYPFNG